MRRSIAQPYTLTDPIPGFSKLTFRYILAAFFSDSTDTHSKMKTEQQLNIDQVWEQFHKTGADHFRNLLMEHYVDLVENTAKWLHSKLHDMVELDDLTTAGVFGLLDAIKAFDPAKGVKFHTFCSLRIRGSILDELRSMDWVPRLVRARVHQLAKATHLLRTHLGRKPSEEEIAKELNVDMKEFNKFWRDGNVVGLVSLDVTYSDGDSEYDFRITDVTRDKKSQDPATWAQKQDLKNLLTKGFTPAEQLIIVLYYYEEMTLKEIGKTLDLCESRVSQIHSSIIARLKVHMSCRRKEFAIK